MIFHLLGRADVNGRGNHVVAGLTHIDVIVWVDNFARTDRFSGQLRATVGDHFVCVRVRARPRAGLKNVEREMFVQLALDYFFSGLDNERGAIGIEQSEFMIRLSGAAQANHDLGLLDADRAALIVQAAEEVIEGKLDEHFPLDIFQTGSGTSTNTNANEVIANRCAELAGKPIGSREVVHPNDHVNMGQSSNDVIPSAIHISAAEELKNHLVPSLAKLHRALEAKAEEFWDVIKVGRTHLMDATPVRLGQEFSGYAQQVAYGKARAENAIDVLLELALGGTAVGTGINRHVDLPAKMIRHLEHRTNIKFYEAKDHFEAQGSKDAVVEASGQLKTIAVSLFKIANDIRWLASGPRCGIGEIQLPATQPGSSIMPGKVNPVLCESLMMVCAQV